MQTTKKIVVLGGGFAGIACIRTLLKQKSAHKYQLVLISDKNHFEYHAALYRLVTGGSTQETCVPLKKLINTKRVTLIKDTISQIDSVHKSCHGVSGNIYPYDYLVVALGSKTSYRDIPGLEKNAYSFKNFHEANQLKTHLHQIFERASAFKTKSAKQSTARITVVGGGASGVELAAELAEYTKMISAHHQIDAGLIKIDLIQSRNRLLPELPSRLSQKVTAHLKSLGINVILNRRVVKEDFNTIYFEEDSIQSKTLIWTAGVTFPTVLKTANFPKDDAGFISINQYLQVEGHPEVFIAGDNARTKYTGLAQTAIKHGTLIAQNIVRYEASLPLIKSTDSVPIYAIPLGKKTAVVIYKKAQLYGYLGWLVRRLLDLKVFLSLMPPQTTLTCYLGGFKKLESCPDCL